MKTNAKTIQGITKKGRTGIRYEHDIKIGDNVRVYGRTGKVVGPGMAGMPEVEFECGQTNYCYPDQMEIVE